MGRIRSHICRLADGTPPTDVFGRMMILKDRAEGVEIVSYVLLILLLSGVFIGLLKEQPDVHSRISFSYRLSVLYRSSLRLQPMPIRHRNMPMVFAPTAVDWQNIFQG